MNKLIIIILVIGIIYRLISTSGGNFIFNMDNARDMVDVREMVVLKKLRLIGPTSAIDGFYNGPAWYYLLAIPFIFSGGDPYAPLIMEIILWAVGGFFLLKLIKAWGKWLIIPIGIIWVFSNYIILANLYAFNPNPVVFLTPLFIYLLAEYLKNNKAVYGILAWFLGGLFFNFEMNFGIFIPVIILAGAVFANNIKFLKQKSFWLGFNVFILMLMPQILFDLKHGFIMSKAIMRHLSENSVTNLNILNRFQTTVQIFFSTFSATLFNQKILVLIFLAIFIPVFLKKAKKDITILVSLTVIIIPFLGYLILPVTVNPWHLGAESAALLILIVYILNRRIFIPLSIVIIYFGAANLLNYFINDFGKPSMDPSIYKNEVAAIDYVYQKAKGSNFKAYTYLPSVYDYPYQYLFWWYGQKKYGYTPGEYVYSPNKPAYIPSQEKFQGSKKDFSGLVFLIKEPDRIKMRQAWENDYKDMAFVSKEMVGPLEIEIRRE